MDSLSQFDLSKCQKIKDIHLGKQSFAALFEDKKSKIRYIKLSCSLNDENNDIYEKISENPFHLQIIGYCNEKSENNTISKSIILKYPVNGYLFDQDNSNNIDHFSSTQKFIILLGILLGIQHLHINNLFHGFLNSNCIFLDNNLYPKVFFPFYEIYNLNFADQNKKEINDIISICFIAYELINGRKIFNDDKDIDEKLEDFHLSNCDNEWIQSFLKKFWPEEKTYWHINDIIDELINNKEKFGDIEEDKILAFLIYVKENQNENLKMLKNNAENNDEKSMLLYGKILKYGYYIEKNNKLAAYYFKKASLLGNADAMYEYGVMLKNGDCILQNKEKAIYWLKKSSENDHIGALYQYGRILHDETNSEMNLKGLHLIKMAADQGLIEAQFFYAMNNNEKTLQDAVKYYKQPADNGYIIAMNNLGVQLYDSEESEYNNCYSLSSKYLKMAIAIGNSISMYNYGIHLINGDKIPQNINEGIRYIKMAADQGQINSIKFFGNMLFIGENIEKNEIEASKYIKLAADKGDCYSMNLYGTMLRDGIGVEKNLEEAAHYFKMCFLTDYNQSEAMLNYGKMIIDEDEMEALVFIKRSVSLGNMQAIVFQKCYYENKIEKLLKNNQFQENFIDQFNNMDEEQQADIIFKHAIFLYNGENIEINKPLAAQLYRFSADKGHIGAMNNYAFMLKNGDGIAMNKLEAARYFKMAADKGHEISRLELISMLYYGDGIPINKVDAIPYIKKSKEEDFLFAINLYEKMIKNGEIIEEKAPEVILHLRQEIYNGDENSMFSLAVRLLEGNGIYKSRKDAANFFKMAAEKGHLAAMFKYGHMLYEGNGIPQNKSEAAHFFKMAADKGHCISMNFYAFMLQNGDGIKQNKIEASQYYKLAADQGLAASMNNYGLMLKDGDGILQNKERALKYLKKAVENGDDINKLNYGIFKYELNNKTKSIKYIKMSADEGNNDARLLYGNCLYKGDVVPINKSEAARYYKMAADDGSIQSMYKYAEMLEKGDGIPLDIQQAKKYYKKILLKNDSKASAKLNELQINYSQCL
ncbi:hypothetical protein M9Y10_021328 [Tritrichomonas musculus]|uniref:Protein kinase domain-containing protein n=1 Tax=Tritrichomonas musculus TaxID=1915356 RepID=A0ABR2HEK2_9EUKA